MKLGEERQDDKKGQVLKVSQGWKSAGGEVRKQGGRWSRRMEQEGCKGGIRRRERSRRS